MERGIHGTVNLYAVDTQILKDFLVICEAEIDAAAEKELHPKGAPQVTAE